MPKHRKNTRKAGKRRSGGDGGGHPARQPIANPLQTARTDAGASLTAKAPAPAGNGQNGAFPAAGGLARILRPAAAMRWSLPMVAQMTPQRVETILRGATAGNHVQQWQLFDLMLDTWPELASCQNELVESVMSRNPGYAACAAAGEPPSAAALEKTRLVDTALRRMAPAPGADENDLDGTLRDLLDGWFRGVVVCETEWQVVGAGSLGRVVGPRCTFWAAPEYIAWGTDGTLGLLRGEDVLAFPEHKFLTGIHKGRSGSPLGTAILRPLAWWWCAANFASDWLLNLAQIFGLPFRWANHEPNASQETVDAICNMLQNMGSAGWAAFPAGTTLELKDGGKSGDASPQGDLLDRADRYARMLILGQTLSGGADASKGGGKAFGAVEADVKTARMDAAAKYVLGIINKQLVPSIIALNYGTAEECPELTLTATASAGLEDANRDQVLAALMPLSIPALREKYNMPEPGEDEEATTAHTKTQDTKPQDPRQEPLPARLAALAGEPDDALFAKELAELIESL